MIVTFCGHSQYTQTPEDERRLLAFLEERINDLPAELYLGGYGAFDAFAYACGRKFQEKHPSTRLVFVTPYITPEYQKNHLRSYQSRYDAIVYAPLEDVPLKFAISRRNQWMVEQADHIVAYIEHAWGGAYQTYKHAKRKQKSVFNLADKGL